LQKVEKIFNALKKDSVEKVKNKLISLGLLNFNEDKLSECNPQADSTDTGYKSSMEIIDESTPLMETPVKGGYSMPTSSYSIRKTKVNEEIKDRKEFEIPK
jgi:hypothetical protein